MSTQDQKQRKARIIHFIWWIPHYRAPIFRRLSQNPHIDFTVCAGENANVSEVTKIASVDETGKTEGINWRRVKSSRISGPLFRNFEWQPEAVVMTLTEDIDVVISLGYQSLSNLLIRIICKIRGIPVLEWTHGVKREERGLRWFIRKLYFKWAKAFLLYGCFAKDYFVRHGFREEKLFVVRNSLDYDAQKAVRDKITPEEIQNCRAQFGVTSAQDRLVFNSGRLERTKRLNLLIEALAKLKQQGQNVYLVLIGDGNHGEALQLLANDLNVSDMVQFYGACYDEEQLGRIISSSDLCVVPGEVGLIAMHSLVYGTPLLTCENTRNMHGPEIETVIEGKTGRFFRDGDANDLSEKLEQMLFPFPRKQQMSKACMEIIDTKYTPQHQERIIIQALNYVLPLHKQIPSPE